MQLHLKLSFLAVAAAVTMPPPEKKQRTHTHQQPNPPVFPASVVVFGPDDRNISETMAARSEVLNDRARGHFSSERLAFLFKPGRYDDVEAKIGYYTSVTGLGASPDEVVFTGERGIYVDAMDPQQAGSLDTFWRSGAAWLTAQRKPAVASCRKLSPDRQNVSSEPACCGSIAST